MSFHTGVLHCWPKFKLVSDTRLVRGKVGNPLERYFSTRFMAMTVKLFMKYLLHKLHLLSTALVGETAKEPSTELNMWRIKAFSLLQDGEQGWVFLHRFGRGCRSFFWRGGERGETKMSLYWK